MDVDREKSSSASTSTRSIGFDLAKAIIDRALLRIPDDVRSCLHAITDPSFDGCDLCDEDPRPDAPDDRNIATWTVPGPLRCTMQRAREPAP